jgi:hypothetical protein
MEPTTTKKHPRATPSVQVQPRCAPGLEEVHSCCPWRRQLGNFLHASLQLSPCSIPSRVRLGLLLAHPGQLLFERAQFASGACARHLLMQLGSQALHLLLSCLQPRQPEPTMSCLKLNLKGACD